jgi:RNA polymerase sigma-70 factor (family 1)
MQENTISRFQKGDKESYRLLFKILYPALCLFAKKFIYDYDDAEDITQEIFIELWNQRTKFESLDQIKAFLYLSVKNRCLNFKKHQLIKEKYFKTALIEDDPPFEETIIEAEVIQNLSNAIESLPEQQKHVILQSLQGLTNNEIANNMDISINTVKLHKKTAYKQLREKLSSSAFILALLF